MPARYPSAGAWGPPHIVTTDFEKASPFAEDLLFLQELCLFGQLGSNHL